LGYQDVPEQLYPNQRMDMLDNEQKRFNLRYLGQFDWGSLEARAYHERSITSWTSGPTSASGMGRPRVVRGPKWAPCSPISGTCAAGMPMYSKSKTTGFNLKADIVLGTQDLLRVGGQYQQLHARRLVAGFRLAACGPAPSTTSTMASATDGIVCRMGSTLHSAVDELLAYAL
jgi:hypothetical protein